MPLSHVVTSLDVATALGSGDVPVLATPRLIAWLEAATVDACPALGPDETSVGTRVDVEHLIATPIGARVDAEAEVVHRDGRLLRFAVTAHHDTGQGPVLIAQGQVTRVVVRREPFLARTIPPLIIREALPEELPAVGELRVEAYVAGYGMATEEVGYAAVLRDAPGHAAHAEILVAVRHGELVGTVAIAPAGVPLAEAAQPGEVEFRFMAVAPRVWRQGVAQALLEAVISRAEGQSLVCSVIEGNEPAAALYLAHGFMPITSRDHEPVPGVRLRVFVRSPSLS
ncbi:MAG: GNAT family N-acetyltransferase [Actinobacteria bacterium]|nr:GNAT family N-acetyltransferase [Actinomycetota bacterium]